MQHLEKRVLVLTLVLLVLAFFASSYTELLITGQQVLLQAEDVEQRSTAFLDEAIALSPSFETAMRRNDPSVFAITGPVASNLAGGAQGGNPLSNDTNITNITITPVPPVTLLGPKNIHLLYLMEDTKKWEREIMHLILDQNGNILSKQKTYNVSFFDFFLDDPSMDLDSQNKGHITVVRYDEHSINTRDILYKTINPFSHEEIVPFPYSDGKNGFLPYFVDVRTDHTDTPFIVAFGVYYEGGSIKDSRIYLTKKTAAGWWQTPKMMVVTDTYTLRYPPRPSFHFDGNSHGRIIYGTTRDIGMPPELRWTFYELVFESSGLVLTHRKINSGPGYTYNSEIHDIKTATDLSTNSYLGYVHSVERIQPPTSSTDEVYFSSSLNNWLHKTIKTLRREPYTEPPASLDILLDYTTNSAVPILYLPVTLRDSQANLSRLLLFSSVDGGGLWTETPLTSSQNYFTNVNVLRANQRMYITYLERDKNRGPVVDFMMLQLTWFDGKYWTTKLLEQMAEGSRIRSHRIHMET